MNGIKHIICWFLDHEWTTTAVEQHENDEHAPLRITETCTRCAKEQIVWARPR